jgi:hypothetical protein
MDNRSYDPDSVPKEHVTPGPVDQQPGHTLGPHHEQPVPVDPLGGISQNPSIPDVMGPISSSDSQRQSFEPEYQQAAIANQPQFAADQPTGPGPYQPEYMAQPGPGYPPPPPGEPRKGFNWMMCCGISCGVLLVLFIIIFALTYKWFKPLMNSGMALKTSSEAVEQADVNTIESQAQTVTAQQLADGGEGYAGKWLVLEAQLGQSEGSFDGNMGGAVPQLENATGYFVPPSVALFDISGAAAVGDEGDTVRAVGQAVVLDLTKVFGEKISEEMAKDNEGAPPRVVFFIAKEVTLVEAGEATPDTGTAEDGAATGEDVEETDDTADEDGVTMPSSV